MANAPAGGAKDNIVNLRAGGGNAKSSAGGTGAAGSGGAGGGDDMSNMSREEAEARLRATEKHVDAVEANINATLERFAAKVDHLPSTVVLLFSVVGGIATAVGLMLAAYAYGGDRFDGGVQVATGLAQQTVEAQQLANKNAQQIEALIERSNKTDTQVEAIYKALVGNGSGKVPDGQNE